MRITEILKPREQLELMRLITDSITQQLSDTGTATKRAQAKAKIRRKTGVFKTDVMRRFTKI